MNIIKFHIIVLIEKYNKVTDVAAELGVKQPTVTFHMKNLESELGTSLFEYRSGRVLLTEAGQTLYQYAVKIVALAAEAERSVKLFTSTSHGSLELEASFVPGTHIVPQMTAKYLSVNPGVHFSLKLRPDSLVREHLRAREIPMALIHSTSTKDDSFHMQLVSLDETVLIFAPGHDFDSAKELTPEQVAREPWIQHTQGFCLRETIDKWAELNNVRLWNRAELDSPEAVKGLVSAGGCVGIYSKVGIEAELLSGRLCCAPLPGVLPERGGFFLAWRKDHILTPVQQAFADMLRDSGQTLEV